LEEKNLFYGRVRIKNDGFSAQAEILIWQVFIFFI